jgi:hypothetical protein
VDGAGRATWGDTGRSTWGSDGVMVDFVVDRDDRLPGMLDSVQQVTGALRHARGTLLAACRKD